MDWDIHFTFLNGHFRSRSIRYKGIWLYLLCHCTPWLNRQAYLVPTMLAPQWNYRMWVVYLTELPGDILNLIPYIFDDNEREGRIMLLLELMEVEITSFYCISGHWLFDDVFTKKMSTDVQINVLHTTAVIIVTALLRLTLCSNSKEAVTVALA